MASQIVPVVAADSHAKENPVTEIITGDSEDEEWHHFLSFLSCLSNHDHFFKWPTATQEFSGLMGRSGARVVCLASPPFQHGGPLRPHLDHRSIPNLYGGIKK